MIKGLVRKLRGKTPLVIPPEAEAHFHVPGYYVFDTNLPESVLDGAIDDLDGRYNNGGKLHHGARVMDAWRDSRHVRTIALWPRVLWLLEQLYGRRPKPFQTLNFPIGTEQYLHADSIHFDCDPPTFMCGVWVALEDIDETNGPLVFYPGSHRLPQLKMDDVAPAPGPEYYHLYEAAVQKQVEASGLKPKQALLRKGQAVVWAANLVHGGSPHLDKSRTRHSQVTHYFFRGCQYFQPLESYGGYRKLLKPDWVR